MPKILQAQHDFLALEFLNPRKLMNLFLVNFGGSTTVEVCQQIHSVFIYIYIYWKVFCISYVQYTSQSLPISKQPWFVNEIY